jgi:hypothetical protein
MALWNVALAAGWRTIFYPSVGTALATGCHWLHVVCPACQQMGEADLPEIDIHPNASLGTVVRKMSCQRCSPHPPFAQPLGATRRSWYRGDGWEMRPRNARRWAANSPSPFARSTDEPLLPFSYDDIEGPGWAQNQIAARKDEG